MQTTTETLMNGVNLQMWNDTIEAVKERPELAKFIFRASNQWLDGAQNRTQIKDFYGACQEDTSRAQAFVLDASEPVVLLGKDNAPSPAEYLLHSLAACLTTSLVYNAAAAGIEIQEVESSLHGEIDLQGTLQLRDDVRKGLQYVTVNFRVKSNASIEELRKLMTLSPVYDIISNPVPINLHIENEPVS